MMNVSQLCLIEDSKLKFDTINALVQRKRQIRINISTPNTTRKHSPHTQHHPYVQQHHHSPSNQQDHPQEQMVQTVPIKQMDFHPKNTINSKPNDDLYEVIYRQKSKMASIGWFQQTPTPRNSNMSRTFRRRRRSNLQEYSTINHSSLFYIDENGENEIESGQARQSNLELSGFTNEEIVKKVNKSALSICNKRNNKQLLKYPKILTFIGQNKIKRVEFILPQQSSQNAAPLLNNKIRNKWKIIPHNPQQRNKSSKIQYKPQSSSPQRSALKQQHPFLKKIQPKRQKPQPIKPLLEKRFRSQFIYSRPRMIIQTPIQNEQRSVLQQMYRPWSVKKNNMQQKLEQGQQVKQVESEKVQLQ